MLQSKSNVMRTISLAIAAVFLLVSILACTESVSAATKLKVTATKKTIYVGKTTKLTANKNVKWSVSNSKIAKLTNKKKKTVTVKGLKAGTVYVKAKAGKTTKKIKITVKAYKRLTLTPTKKKIGLGEFCTVNEKSTDFADLNFTSSDKSIATVSSRGLVEGRDEGTVTITATSKANKMVKGSTKITVLPTRAGNITLHVDLSDEESCPAGKVVKVWLPMPQRDEHQNIRYLNCNAGGDPLIKETKDSDGGKQYYIEWDEDTLPEDRVADLSYHIYRRAVLRDESIESNKSIVDDVDTDEFSDYLKETYYSGDLDSGIVKDTADEIVAAAGATTVYQKAYAIYDWMCDNLIRFDNPNIALKGDIPSILEAGKANTCIEVSQVFAILCRAEGIPARSLYGIRFINKNGIPSPNCRAEFYLPGYGWVAADPALAIKQSWGHESEYLGPDATDEGRAEWEGIKDIYWGNAEENWICLNKGHDIWLDPPQEADTEGEYMEVLNPDGTINYYILPYAEVDGQYLSVAKYKYEYLKFEEEDPLDCGCL